MSKRIWWIALVAMLAAIAVVIVIIVRSPSKPSVTPTPSSSSSQPSAGSTTPSATPSDTESSADKQKREDFAAAETAYRTFHKEYDRLANAGGVKTLPKSLTDVTAGSMLKDFGDGLKNLHESGWRQVGYYEVASIDDKSYAPTELRLGTCIDGRAVTVRDEHDVVQVRGDVGTSTVTMRRIDGKWKAWASASGKTVKSCGR